MNPQGFSFKAIQLWVTQKSFRSKQGYLLAAVLPVSSPIGHLPFVQRYA